MVTSTDLHVQGAPMISTDSRKLALVALVEAYGRRAESRLSDPYTKLVLDGLRVASDRVVEKPDEATTYLMALSNVFRTLPEPLPRRNFHLEALDTAYHLVCTTQPSEYNLLLNRVEQIVGEIRALLGR